MNFGVESKVFEGMMQRLRSVSIRIMIAISLVAAASCAGLAAFGYWRQQTATTLALHRELNSDYTDMLNAMESDTRAVQVVANALATIPEFKALVRGKDREGILNLLSSTLKDIKPLGIELISINVPPGIMIARLHNPTVFGDDVTARRKTIVQSYSTKKPVGGIEAGRDVLNIFGTAPMFDGDTLLGAVDIGAPFGDTFVKSMKSRLGVDVAIHQVTDDNVKTLASTIKDITPSKDAIKRALAGESIIVMGKRDGQPIATTYGLIKNFSGQPIAVAEIIRNTTVYQELARDSTMWLAAGAAVTVLIAALFASWLGRGLARPILALENSMRVMTSGRHDVAVPGASRHDEIGSMARAVEVFKDGLIETGRLRTAQEEQRLTMETERHNTVQTLAAKFEDGIGSIVDTVGAAATELRGTAEFDGRHRQRSDAADNGCCCGCRNSIAERSSSRRCD